MLKDQADHEWTTWKISASQSREKNILEKKNNIFICSRDLRCLISSLLLADEEIPERLQLNIKCKYFFEIF